MSNKLTTMAREILNIEADLPHRLDYTKSPRPSLDDFEIYTFEQIWGSTALGFGGVGGQAMTSARTYVFVPESCYEKCFVYFAGRFAYAVNYSASFMEDVAHREMASVSASGKYTKNSAEVMS